MEDEQWDTEKWSEGDIEHAATGLVQYQGLSLNGRQADRLIEPENKWGREREGYGEQDGNKIRWICTHGKGKKKSNKEMQYKKDQMVKQSRKIWQRERNHWRNKKKDIKQEIRKQCLRKEVKVWAIGVEQQVRINHSAAPPSSLPNTPTPPHHKPSVRSFATN